MASQCFKPTPAFRKKEQQVRQSVDKETKERLHKDIEKLFGDAQYSDLLLLVDSKQLPVHSFILRARYPEFYEYCQSHSEDNKISITGISFEDLKRCLRSVYSKDSIDCIDVEKALSLEMLKNSADRNACLSADLLSLVDGSTGDIDFVVEGKLIKAHKAILATRCDYFAAMFSPFWKEASSSTIAIPYVDYDLFVAALKFLYGASHDILTLKTSKVLQFADMYSMEELQIVVTSHLRITKCHLFHKPCELCIPEVYECLKFCEAFNLQTLKLQCIQWIGKNFVKTLACKKFPLMPESFQEDVRFAIEKQIAKSTALEIWSKCTALIASVNNYQTKWARLVEDLVEKIRATCLNVVMEHFVCICNSPIITSFLKETSYSSSLLEQFLNALLDTLTVHNCCRVLQGLLILTQQPSCGDPFDSETFTVVEKSCKRCEKFIISNIGQVTTTKAWQNIGASKQKELKNAAFFVDF